MNKLTALTMMIVILSIFVPMSFALLTGSIPAMVAHVAFNAFIVGAVLTPAAIAIDAYKSL